MTHLTLSLLLVGAAPLASQSPGPIVFTHVSVVDVETGRVRADQTVVVVGNRISAAGPSAATKAPAGATVIDGRGKYLIPGLWDLHVHAATPWFGDLFLPLLVANGVTGVREMFSTTAAVRTWREQIASGAKVGPRIGTFGSLVDGDPPIWPGSVVAKTPEDGRRVVDSLVAARVEFVKVYSRLEPETFAAIAAESKAKGVPFAGHIPGLVPAAEAARLGQRTVEHLTQILLGCSSREEEFLAQSRAAVASPKRWDSAGVVSRGRVEALLASQDRARCERLADELKAAGTYLVPTLTVLHSIAYLDDPTLAQDSRLKYIPAYLKTGWNPKTDFRFKMLTPADWLLRKRQNARELEVIRLMIRRGVKVLAGTDLANPFLYPGWSLHDELALLVSVGMTPLQALASATIEPARFLGAADSLGTVAAGKVADLVLLGANPLADIGNVGTVLVVVADGRLYDEVARARLLAEGERRAAGGVQQ